MASIGALGCFIVDDRRKRINNDAFSNGDASVWIGENKRKTLVWAKHSLLGFDEEEENGHY